MLEELIGKSESNKHINLYICPLTIGHDLSTGIVRVDRGLWDGLSEAEQQWCINEYQKEQDKNDSQIDSEIKVSILL